MADMQFDLVSPERSLASFMATSVQIPGADGDMTVMADHAPTITTLRPGLMEVVTGSETHEFVVTGGFAEIGAGGVSVLAEDAMPKADVTSDILDQKVAAARSAAESASAETIDAAQKLVADLEALRSQIV